MKNILITGGAGYIGSALVLELIKKGYNVTIYDSFFYDQKKVLSFLDNLLNKDLGLIEAFLNNSNSDKISLNFKNFKFVKGDVRDKSSLNKLFSKNKFDCVIHLGELVGHYRCEANPLITKAVNYDGTKNIINLAIKNKALFICNSSSSVYGSRENPDTILNEEAELFTKELDTYCKNKLLTEEYIIQQGAKNKDFNYIVLRPATVGGLSPRMRLDLLPNHFTYASTIQKRISITKPNNYRAIIDINDMIKAYIAILKSNKIYKGIYNIGCHNMTKKQYLDIILNVLKPDNIIIKSIGEIGNERNLKISSDKFEKFFNFKTSTQFKDTVLPLVKLLREKPDIFSSNNFETVLNISLEEWNMLLS